MARTVKVYQKADLERFYQHTFPGVNYMLDWWALNDATHKVAVGDGSQIFADDSSPHVPPESFERATRAHAECAWQWAVDEDAPRQ